MYLCLHVDSSYVCSCRVSKLSAAPHGDAFDAYAACIEKHGGEIGRVGRRWVSHRLFSHSTFDSLHVCLCSMLQCKKFKAALDATLA